MQRDAGAPSAANRGTGPLILLHAHQLPIARDHVTGMIILHWSRQIGKSYALAAWAIERLLLMLQKCDRWLVTVLSNSKDNGIEFNLKAQEIATKYQLNPISEDLSTNEHFENMRLETRFVMGGKLGRIKVLAANPRTARGFSGDLILDEFAFHEDSNAIWEAAEPILSRNPDFLCRIASTGNGKYNMFYRMVSCGEYQVSRVSRTDAWRQGIQIFDPNTRKPITPDEARKKALDKRAYDQNYELAFNDEASALLTHELISAAERSPITIDEQTWTPASIGRLVRCKGFWVGNDIGRVRDLSVVTCGDRDGNTKRVLAMLRMSNMRGPDQRRQLQTVCSLPIFRGYCGDLTGMGLFFVEELQELFGTWRIQGVNFASTEPINERIRAEGRKAETTRVTENMATDLLGAFEDRAIEIPADLELREDVRKPEKLVTPSGRVSIAATRDEAGHADHFWSLALWLRAMAGTSGPLQFQRITLPNYELGRPSGFSRHKGVLI